MPSIPAARCTEFWRAVGFGRVPLSADARLLASWALAAVWTPFGGTPALPSPSFPEARAWRAHTRGRKDTSTQARNRTYHTRPCGPELCIDSAHQEHSQGHDKVRLPGVPDSPKRVYGEARLDERRTSVSLVRWRAGSRQAWQARCMGGGLDLGAAESCRGRLIWLLFPETTKRSFVPWTVPRSPLAVPGKCQSAQRERTGNAGSGSGQETGIRPPDLTQKRPRGLVRHAPCAMSHEPRAMSERPWARHARPGRHDARAQAHSGDQGVGRRI